MGSWSSTTSERSTTLLKAPSAALSSVAGFVGVVCFSTEGGFFTEEAVEAFEAVLVVVRGAAAGFVVERVS